MLSQFDRLTKILAKSLDLDGDNLVASFRLADIDDIPKITALRCRVFSRLVKEDDERYLRWRYFDRPGFSSTMWVFDFSHQIIAALGTEPVELSHDGDIEPALRNMDISVDPKYDGRGLGAWMALAMQNQNNCILVTGGNKNSFSMLNKLFTALPVRKTFKIILHSRFYLGQKFHNPFISGLISPLFDFAFKSYLKIKWLSKDLPENLSLVVFSGVGELLDLIVDPVGCLAEVKVVRSKAYLKWRYVDKPGCQFRAIGVLDEGKLLAYAIYIIENGKDPGAIREGKIVDWYINSKANATQVLASLFIAATKDMKKRGTDEILLVLNDNISEQAAVSAGFIFRDLQSDFFVYHCKLTDSSHIFSPDAWYQSFGDSDSL
ncbi:hypothetical protein N9164_07115 [Draconibacterium sp.]|nr:hypothetical protein [Draconibacterium sp.]